MGIFGHDVANIGTSAIGKDIYSKSDRRTKYTDKELNYIGDKETPAAIDAYKDDSVVDDDEDLVDSLEDEDDEHKKEDID